MKLKIGLYFRNNIQGLQVRLIARYHATQWAIIGEKRLSDISILNFNINPWRIVKYCGEKFPYTHQYRFLF